MNRRVSLSILTSCALALGCRHHLHLAPVVTPMASANAAPAVRVTPTTNDFASPNAEPDPLADVSTATEVADQRGWLTQSRELPATTCSPRSEPSGAISANRSSVPFHGMFGWLQRVHASVEPSGETRGAA